MHNTGTFETSNYTSLPTTRYALEKTASHTSVPTAINSSSATTTLHKQDNCPREDTIYFMSNNHYITGHPRQTL
eukprot:324773-Amphidinium_carterae.1